MAARVLFLAFLVLAAQALPATASGRIALVIGNSDYRHVPALPNPVNDATAMARSLEAVGFEVLLGTDLDRDGTHRIFRAFSRALEDAETGLFFYAGHGLQVNGRNYLAPVDARLATESDLDFEAVNLEVALRQLRRADRHKATRKLGKCSVSANGSRKEMLAILAQCRDARRLSECFRCRR